MPICDNCKEDVIGTTDGLCCDCRELIEKEFEMMPDDNEFDKSEDKAKTEIVSPGIDQIPFEGIEALGEIFAEGEVKYGRDNWKKGVNDEKYQKERLRHAMRHLMKWANDDRSEPHLAKVMWFCVTQIWTEKNKN